MNSSLSGFERPRPSPSPWFDAAHVREGARSFVIGEPGSSSKTAVLWAASCITLCYADRVNISVAVVEMAKEFGWSLEERGRLLSAFFYGYILSQLFGSWLGDRYGYKRVITVATAMSVPPCLRKPDPYRTIFVSILSLCRTIVRGFGSESSGAHVHKSACLLTILRAACALRWCVLTYLTAFAADHSLSVSQGICPSLL